MTNKQSSPPTSSNQNRVNPRVLDSWASLIVGSIIKGRLYDPVTREPSWVHGKAISYRLGDKLNGAWFRVILDHEVNTCEGRTNTVSVYRRPFKSVIEIHERLIADKDIDEEKTRQVHEAFKSLHGDSSDDNRNDDEYVSIRKKR